MDRVEAWTRDESGRVKDGKGAREAEGAEGSKGAKGATMDDAAWMGTHTNKTPFQSNSVPYTFCP
jgi:hypothetical protein